MDANRFGKKISWTTFGESHGEALGVVIDGIPSGIFVDIEFLKYQLSRRRPGQNEVVTDRQEFDNPEILSGVFEGKTLGTPIAVIVRNQDQKSEDYEKIKNNPRPGHADKIWKEKFGHVDHRGGGRSSGRETLSRVIAGSFCEMYLRTKIKDIQVLSYASQIGSFQLNDLEKNKIISREYIDSFKTRFPSENEAQVVSHLKNLKEAGDSLGGVVTTTVKNFPAGVGEPIFYKLKSQLALAMMSIGATSSFAVGEGAKNIEQRGSEFHLNSKNYGGLSGGMSSGETLEFHVGFKPTSSILDVAKKGRHDPCIVPRACVVVEAMTWSVLADLY